MGPQVDGPLERGRDARWKDVPDIFWRDVNGKKVYLRSRVVPATIVSAGGANVSEAIGMLMDSALDLNPQELPPVFNPDVVALGVAPGPGNVQPMFGGAGHKLQFCPLPAFFCGSLCLFPHWSLIWAQKRKSTAPKRTALFFSTYNSIISIGNTNLGHVC